MPRRQLFASMNNGNKDTKLDSPWISRLFSSSEFQCVPYGYPSFTSIPMAYTLILAASSVTDSMGAMLILSC